MILFFLQGKTMENKTIQNSNKVISVYSDNMKKRPLLTLTVTGFIVIVLSLAALRASEVITRASASIDEIDVSKAMSVNTVEAKLVDQYVTVQNISGQIMAARESNHGFDRSGILAEVMVDEGDRVKKGDILAKLDTRTLEAQNAQLRADLESAKASKNEAQTNLDRANAAYKRSEVLKENGHISQQRFDQAENDLAAAQARFTTANSNITKVNAAIDANNAELDLSMLRAQFDGSVTKRFLDEGASFGMGGGPMIRLIEDSNLEIRVGLTELAATNMTIGQHYLFNQNGREVRTTLKSIVGQIDQNTRTVTAIFVVNDDQLVIPGSLAEISVNVNVMESGYWLPTEALAESRRGLWTVYSLSPIEGRQDVAELNRQELQLIYTEADRVFVRGTLKDGDQIVSSGTHRLASGFLVKVN